MILPRIILSKWKIQNRRWETNNKLFKFPLKPSLIFQKYLNKFWNN